MTARISGLALVLLGLGITTGEAADPTGSWMGPDQDAIVRIADCAALRSSSAQPDTPSGMLCGVVVWLKEPIDPLTGKPRVDSMNVDPAKKYQPILGMYGIFDMHPSARPDRWEGRVYNVDDGRIYDGHMIMKSDNELYIEGCVLMLCRGEQWVRHDVPDPAKTATAATTAKPARPATLSAHPGSD